MSSDQDSKQNEIPILRTGIQVMNELFLDARMVISLAYDGLLIPYIPRDIPKNNFKFYMNSTESQENRLSEWRYRKSDVEEFKLKYKDSLDEIRQQGYSKSRFHAKIGKKGGGKEKTNQPILEAVIKYMFENNKLHDKKNGFIATSFCKKYKNEDKAIIVNVGDTEWEIYSSGFSTEDLIFSRVYKAGIKKVQHKEKSIKFNTLRNAYIPKAKKSISDVSDK